MSEEQLWQYLETVEGKDKLLAIININIEEIERLQKLLNIEKNKREQFDKDNKRIHSNIKEAIDYIEENMGYYSERLEYKEDTERYVKDLNKIIKLLNKGE